MRVAIILVNWNGWRDTIECLESLLKSGFPEFRVIVCDNGSTDGSFQKVQDWAQGKILSEPTDSNMARFSSPPISKPVELLVVDPEGQQNGPENARVVLIQTGSNLGFAGGNNVGLRFAMDQGNFDLYWLLNNDTVVEPEALGHIVDRFEEAGGKGICGTTLRFYYEPIIIQARNGARFNRLTCLSRGIGAGESAELQKDRTWVENQTDFVTGASLCVSHDFLETVGLMEKRYFLYFEEIDWATRNGGRFPTLYADKATVFHKEGGAIGSSSGKGQRSKMSEFYLTRGKLDYTLRHQPHLLPLIYLSSLGQVARRLWRGDFAKAWIILSILMGRRSFGEV